MRKKFHLTAHALNSCPMWFLFLAILLLGSIASHQTPTERYNNFPCENPSRPNSFFAFSVTSACPRIMVLNNSFTHLTPEDGCEAQQPKRSDIPSHQDEDKSPKIPTQNINIPSSKNLRKTCFSLYNNWRGGYKLDKFRKCFSEIFRWGNINFLWRYFRTFVLILMWGNITTFRLLYLTNSGTTRILSLAVLWLVSIVRHQTSTKHYTNFLCETSCCPNFFAFSVTSARPQIMFLNN